jgi:hypothetical protein
LSCEYLLIFRQNSKRPLWDTQWLGESDSWKKPKVENLLALSHLRGGGSQSRVLTLIGVLTSSAGDSGTAGVFFYHDKCSANTLAFGLIDMWSHKELKNCFGNMNFVFWKRGRAIGILGIHVSNSRNSASSEVRPTAAAGMPNTAETMTRNATGSNNIVNSRDNTSRNIMRSNITREVSKSRDTSNSSISCNIFQSSGVKCRLFTKK